MRRYSLIFLSLLPLFICQASAQYNRQWQDATSGMYLIQDDSFDYDHTRNLDTQYVVDPETGEMKMVIGRPWEPVKINDKVIYPLHEVQPPTLLTSNKKFERYLKRYLLKERKWIDKADGTDKSIVFIINEKGQVSYLRVDGRLNWYKTVSVADFNRFEDSLRQKLTTLTLKPAQRDGQAVPCMVVIPG